MEEVTDTQRLLLHSEARRATSTNVIIVIVGAITMIGFIPAVIWVIIRGNPAKSELARLHRARVAQARQTAIEQQTYNYHQKEQKKAFWLMFFLGPAGRFYLGYHLLGVLQLALWFSGMALFGYTDYLDTNLGENAFYTAEYWLALSGGLLSGVGWFVWWLTDLIRINKGTLKPKNGEYRQKEPLYEDTTGHNLLKGEEANNDRLNSI